MSCPRCHAPVSADSRFCPACGQPIALAEVATITSSDDDQTRLAAAPRSPVSSPGQGSQSGWLSSSGSIDHGRFAIGTVLENRYRILGLLGRGGMGEVYRADDLRLGQQVALKFLPSNLSRDPVRLAQLHNEVRTARQVSHPNVCRVYDIGEIEGQLFLTMEYVDGEDLASLLRRIGRLPEDKALEIARQICAGLAAAHERGVLHRDLKPANVMLDGTGKVRIMDFSLAAAGDVTDIRAGTPAYMAPEQLGGQEVTVRSDIYALGLVLYELFTGRRAFDAKSLADLIEQHQTGAPTPPTMLVKSLDSAIEMAILRCLEPDPARRPASALRVSAALPGGDPLAAALAAGETPSPEMVAAAGDDRRTMSRAAGIVWLAACAAFVLSVAHVSQRSMLLARIPLTKPTPVLVDRAEELRASLGFTDAVADRAFEWRYDRDYLNWADKNGSGRSRWTDLAAGRPAALQFWYRTSPGTFLPVNASNPVTMTDPPLLVDGMTLAVFDTNARLLRFESAPPQVESSAPPGATAIDWNRLFAAAGLDRAAFTEAAPSRTPAAYADERKAWQGVLPGTNTPIRIEAAGYRGRPVLFELVASWTPASREPSPPPRVGTNAYVIYFLLAGAAFAAYMNVRRGRGDRRGAFRLAAFMFVLMSAIWIVEPHVGNASYEQQRFFVGVALAMFIGGAMYLFYLGFEPYVRRAWPHILVTWTRLLSGRVRDPLVGRDLLIGAAIGAAVELLDRFSDTLRPVFGMAEPIPHLPELGALLGPRAFADSLLAALNAGLQNTLITVFQFAGFLAIFEWATRSGLKWAGRRWPRAAGFTMSEKTSQRVFVALAVAAVATVNVLSGDTANERLFDAFYQAISTTILLNVLLRAGIFATLVMFLVNLVLDRVPLTFDGGALYASASWFAIALCIGIAAWGCWMATTSRTRRVHP